MKKIFYTIVLAASFNSLFAQAEEEFKKFPVFNYQKVVEKIFGASFTKKNEFVWKPNFEEQLFFFPVISSDGYCHTKLDTAFDIATPEANYMLLAFSTTKYDKGQMVDCHICGTLVSVALFKKAPDNSFTVEGFKKGFDGFGGFGVSGPYSLAKIGNDAYALGLDRNYMGQGVYQSTMDYFLVTGGGFLKNIFSYEQEYNDAGALGNTTWETKMKVVPAAKSPLYNIVLTTTGKTKTVTKETYKYSEETGMYKLVK